MTTEEEKDELRLAFYKIFLKDNPQITVNAIEIRVESHIRQKKKN